MDHQGNGIDHKIIIVYKDCWESFAEQVVGPLVLLQQVDVEVGKVN